MVISFASPTVMEARGVETTTMWVGVQPRGLWGLIVIRVGMGVGSSIDAPSANGSRLYTSANNKNVEAIRG